MQLLAADDLRLLEECPAVTHVGPVTAHRAHKLMFKCKRERGLGLAAPQVGWMERVFTLNVNGTYATETDDKRIITYGGIICINPEMVWYSPGFTTELEGCLTLPGVHVQVKRHWTIEVNYTTAPGVRRSGVMMGGMLARAFQHELDHLNGLLITAHGVPV